MAAEKFIRVSMRLPAGVALSSAAENRLMGRSPLMTGYLSEFFGEGRLEEKRSSVGRIELTLECPDAKRDELALALEALVRDLRAS